MSEAKSLYSSGIDAQAKIGGLPAAKANLKQSNFNIGDKKIAIRTSEAHDKFKSMTIGHA